MEVQFLRAGLTGLTDDQLHELIAHISDVIDSRRVPWKVPPPSIYSPEPAPTPLVPLAKVLEPRVYRITLELDKTKRYRWKEEYEHIMHLLSPDLLPMNVYVDAEAKLATIRYTDRDRAVIAIDVLTEAYHDGGGAVLDEVDV